MIIFVMIFGGLRGGFRSLFFLYELCLRPIEQIILRVNLLFLVTLYQLILKILSEDK